MNETREKHIGAFIRAHPIFNRTSKRGEIGSGGEDEKTTAKTATHKSELGRENIAPRRAGDGLIKFGFEFYTRGVGGETYIYRRAGGRQLDDGARRLFSESKIILLRLMDVFNRVWSAFNTRTD